MSAKTQVQDTSGNLFIFLVLTNLDIQSNANGSTEAEWKETIKNALLFLQWFVHVKAPLIDVSDEKTLEKGLLQRGKEKNGRKKHVPLFFFNLAIFQFYLHKYALYSFI
jgi:hypothetical protein